MDVACATCGEPWETYHLRHDEVHETEAGITLIDQKIDREKYGANSPLVRPYEGEAWEGKLTTFWRSQFEALGWQFGGSLYAVMRCPCCKDNEERPGAEERRAAYEVVSDVMAGDDDGVASTLATDSFPTLQRLTEVK